LTAATARRSPTIATKTITWPLSPRSSRRPRRRAPRRRGPPFSRDPIRSRSARAMFPPKTNTARLEDGTVTDRVGGRPFGRQCRPSRRSLARPGGGPQEVPRGEGATPRRPRARVPPKRPSDRLRGS
jgi:hypothetical protein